MYPEDYRSCQLCPRACGVDRTAGKLGACHTAAEALVAHSMLHRWEEPCISGERGSGAVFFSGCPLGCVYCQNRKISLGGVGTPYTPTELASLFLSLEEQGAHNVNLVTATHVVPHVALAIEKARAGGLKIPIVYNTSGYESERTLAALHGLVDIYLTDLRYGRAKTARAYSGAADYPEVAERALCRMVEQTGPLLFDEKGLLQRGTVVRLLLLPSHLIEAKSILVRLYRTYGEKVMYSLMRQYTPMTESKEFPALTRRVTAFEYMSFLDAARALGIRNAYAQSAESASESFIPDF